MDKDSWEGSKEDYSVIRDDYNDEMVQERDDSDSDDFPGDFRDNDLDEIDAEISLKET